MRRLVVLLSVLVLVISFQNCAEHSFTQVPSDNSSQLTPDVVLQQSQQSFSSETTRKAIDMVWVIDNSASMTKNVNLVKQNFSAFVKSLGSQVDINVALISRADALSYNTEIRLSDYSSAGVQIPFLVHSYNPMLVAAASTCPKSPSASDAFCQAVKGNSRYDRVYGSLNSFFRSGSQKVFVFVSDDDSANLAMGAKSTIQFDKSSDPKGASIDIVSVSSLTENVDYITPAAFTARMKTAFGSSGSFKSFGFIAYDSKTSPCLARPSNNYKSLIESSGGGHFNICNTNWDSAFTNLTSRVINYAAATYTVSDSNFHSIDVVELNKQALKLGTDYTVNGNVVTLSSALVKGVGSYSITVHYQRTESK
ncbi:vWA domain-containing protein [Bdellovibrio sp. HCB209]|uniref:vWA domain-containing protein n=1 Tax=Bdellovibrio sp. HCB209 TaxID=3394354 RepID=UPI0039B5D30F